MKIISVRDPSKKQRKFILGAFRKGEPFGFVLHLIRFIQPTDCASIVNRTNFLTMSGIKCTHVYFKFAKTVLQLFPLFCSKCQSHRANLKRGELSLCTYQAKASFKC